MSSKEDAMRELAERMQRGDGDAYAELVVQNQASLYRVARSYLRSEEDIADAIQEAILNGWKKRTELRQPAWFRTWLIRILINECLQILRRQKREILTDRTEEWVKDRGTVVEGDLMFDDMMAVLRKPVREVVVLYYGEGFSTGEIAELLGISQMAVRQRLSRGRQELRKRYFGPERESAAKQMKGE